MSRLEDLKRIAEKSKKPLPWYGLAMEYRSVGDYAASVETFERVHLIDAKYVPAYFMCAQVLAEHLAQPERARAELERGIAIALEVGDAHAADEMRGMLETLT
jgi:tetratricopeptide (TPR) repeat protein